MLQFPQQYSMFMVEPDVIMTGLPTNQYGGKLPNMLEQLIQVMDIEPIETELEGSGDIMTGVQDPSFDLKKKLYRKYVRQKTSGRRSQAGGFISALLPLIGSIAIPAISALIKSFTGKGIKRSQVRKLEDNLRVILRNQRGSGIFDTITSLLPVAVDIGKQLFPLVKGLFSGRGKEYIQRGKGPIMSSLIDLGLEALKMAKQGRTPQKGGIFGALIKNIGQIIRRVLSSGQNGKGFFTDLLRGLPSKLAPLVKKYGPIVLKYAKEKGMPFVRSIFK